MSFFVSILFCVFITFFFFPSDANCSDGISFGFGLRRAVFKGRVVTVGTVFLVLPSSARRG
jgi:hypothetical protein